MLLAPQQSSYARASHVSSPVPRRLLNARPLSRVPDILQKAASLGHWPVASSALFSVPEQGLGPTAARVQQDGASGSRRLALPDAFGRHASVLSLGPSRSEPPPKAAARRAQACLVRGINTARTIATRKSAGTSPIR